MLSRIAPCIAPRSLAFEATIAAVPVTCGAAIDVPRTYVYEPPAGGPLHDVPPV